MNRNTSAFRTQKAKLASALQSVGRARLPAFYGLSVDPALVLGNLSIAFVGVGSVGRNIADRIVRLKPRRMCFVDRGRFKPESVETHPIDPRQALRREAKARSAARHCARISPSTECAWFDGPLQALEYAEFIDADLVVLASDNLAAEAAVAQLGVALSKPLMHAAVHGESLVAQVRFYPNDTPDSPCPRCHFSDAEEAMVDQNTILSCTGGTPEFGAQTVPTMSTASLCAMAGDIAAINILRFGLKLGEPLVDQQIEFSGFTNRMVVSPLPRRNADCKCDHTHWQLRRFPKPLGKATFAELAGASGLVSDGELDGVSFSIPHRQYVEMADCGHCGPCRICRFTTTAGELPACPRCHGPLTAQPFFTEEAVAASHLKELIGRPLRDLCVHGAAAVLVRRNDAAVLLHNHPTGNNHENR
ncbi:MAG: ThiF family adenylyltransferase [Tepidisphaerales bacterium]